MLTTLLVAVGMLTASAFSISRLMSQDAWWPPWAAMATAYYDIRGYQLQQPAHGLTIIRMSDGYVRKEMRDKR